MQARVAVSRYGRRTERGLLTAIGRFVGDIRTPTTKRGKIAAVTLAVVVFSLVTLLVVSGFFLSRALNPLQAGETINPTRFLQNAQSLEFQATDGTTHAGWFFPGLRGAPLLILLHGYKSSRSEVLTLATSLQQHRYNVFTFNFAGHGESPIGYTTLGGKELQELRGALTLLQARTDIDTNRIGLWGHSLGAYVALQVAPEVPGVKAVIVDSVYPSPSDLLRRELEHMGADTFPGVAGAGVLEFRVLSVFYGTPGDVAPSLNATAGLPKLFITGEDAPRLAALTRQLYNQGPGPKELVALPRSTMAAMVEEERRNYENVVVTFFSRTLPLVPGS